MASLVKSVFAQTSLSDCLKIFPCSLGGCVVSTDILLTGFGLVCCVASKPRIKQVHNDFSNRMNNYRFSKSSSHQFSLYLS